MSNTDDLAEQQPIEQDQASPIKTLTAKPLHRQFSMILTSLLFTVIMALALMFALFYQQSEQSRISHQGEFTSLSQQYEQLQALQKTEYLVEQLLFIENKINFVESHTELLAVNRELLQLESANEKIYQQWLNANESAREVIFNLQKSNQDNEKLKQSSIIQLQLMWFSITPIINEKIASQALLLQQLKVNNTSYKLRFSRSTVHALGMEELYELQQLKQLMAEVLSRFEQLTIHTSMDDFNLLRLDVENIIAKRDLFKVDAKNIAKADFRKEIDTFENIVANQWGALVMWQDYILIAQSYQLDLTIQYDQIKKILAEPAEKIVVNVPSALNDILNKVESDFKVRITQEGLTIGLLLSLAFTLFIFCYLLLRLRAQIKITSQESVAIICESFTAENIDSIQVNCSETQEIIQKAAAIAKPAPVSDEQETLQLRQQCQTHLQTINEQIQQIEANAQKHKQQQTQHNEKVALQTKNEFKRYKYLENEALSLLQFQQALLINDSKNNIANEVTPPAYSISLYQQIKQFQLASDACSEQSILTLTEVNLIEEMHAILINKQAEQEQYNNQLYFSYDEQILAQTTLDFRLFQQSINLLLDIIFFENKNVQLHLHLQLRDKNEGQQRVSFSARIKGNSLAVLPNLVSELVSAQETNVQQSSLVDVFYILFTKLYGQDISAQLIDEGFQLSFELPFAVSSSSQQEELQQNKLDNIKVMLLSNNEILASVLNRFIDEAPGEFEVLNSVDNIGQQLNKKYLKKYNATLCIVASDISQEHINVITDKINNLPDSLQAKLMLLQSANANLNESGFYSQAEQLLFKGAFLENIQQLLISEESTNQLFSPAQCQQNNYLASNLIVLVAVKSPQKYQNLQRLLHSLGLQVHVVSHADAQRELWKTGLYNILFTEFTESSLLHMASQPLVEIAVFSLTDDIPHCEDKYFDNWHIENLVEQPSLTDLSVLLTPWLKGVELPNEQEVLEDDLAENSIENMGEIICENTCVDDDIDESEIPELLAVMTGDNKEAVFEFSQYLDHQGSVELALFMLDDYSERNHQQLDILIDALKAKDFEKAKSAVVDLQLNAKILAATDLEQLCTQWSKLLNGNDIPSSLKEVNLLLKKTRSALNDIDNYAESI